MTFHHPGPFVLGPLGLFGGLMAALLLVAFVLALVWIVQALNRPGPMRWGAPPPSPGTPLDILARRFAAGEITAEEYVKARDLLSEPPKP